VSQPDPEAAFVSALLHDVIAQRTPIGWANLDDFDLGPAAPTPARIVIDQPGWSLYGLDHARDLAVFTDLPPGTDLADSPFAYATQHRLARHVLTLPLAELEATADLAPPLPRVVLIFSIGRCGSTLLSHALNTVPGVWCLSEPDAFSTLILQHYHSRQRSDFPRAQVIRLIRACTRLQFRPPAGRQATVFAMKFRSQALFQADLYHQALPNAACLFLYRDALGWANSIYSMMRQYAFPSTLTGPDRALAWSIFTAASDPAPLAQVIDFSAPEVPMELALAPAWSCNMAEYTRHLDSGVPFLALRYNEFNRDREASIAHMLRHCGLDASHAATALQAFERDSQSGTHLSREVTTERLSSNRLERLADLMSRLPTFGAPDLILPDIYSPGQ
jgi:LPS sulfotransferase NodH